MLQIAPKTIDSITINLQKPGGLIAEVTPDPHISGLAPAETLRLKTDEFLCTASPDIARPHILGHIGNLDNDGPLVTAPGITVKAARSNEIGLPFCFEFAWPMAKAVAEDLLLLYGQEKFFQTTIRFITRRAFVEPNHAHREMGNENWHTHLAQTTDFIYSACDELPTEFEDVTSLTNTFIRFGGNIKHRSRTNTADRAIKRTWCAFIANLSHTPRNGEACNMAFNNKTRIESFERAAYANISALRLLSNPMPLTAETHDCKMC